MNPSFALYSAARTIKRWLRRRRSVQQPPHQLTSTQRQYLESLVERYCRKTQRSRAYCLNSRPFLADQRNSDFLPNLSKSDPIRAASYGVVADRGKGPRIWDLDGNRLLDCVMGFGVQFCGHGQPFLMDSVRNAVESGAPLGPLCHSVHEVAERLTGLTGTERVAFCNTGSEAVVSALRLARAATGRSKIVVFSPSYHGNFAEALHSCGWSLGGPPGMLRDLVVMDYNTTETLTWLERFGPDLAGVVVEPVRSRALSEDTAPFLRELRRITTRHGCALIFDEVMLGFRIAPGGAQEWFGIRADLVSYGKLLGGGLPIGAVAGTKEFMEPVDVAENRATMLQGTFNRNPLTMATAGSLLRHLEEQGPQLQRRLNTATTDLANRLRSQFVADGVSLQVENFASVLLFSHAVPLLRLHLFERGVHICGEILYLSTAHGEGEMEELFRAVVASTREMQAARLL